MEVNNACEAADVSHAAAWMGPHLPPYLYDVFVKLCIIHIFLIDINIYIT